MKKHYLTGNASYRQLINNEKTLPVIYYLLLAFLICYPLFSPGYILTLDMIWSPDRQYIAEYIFNNGIGGQLPFVTMLQIADLFIPSSIVQKIIVFSVFFISGYSAHVATPAKTIYGKVFAGTLYAVNPFTYTRFLAGHLYLLLAYAFTPLAIRSYYDFLENRSLWKKAAFWFTIPTILDPHMVLIIGIIQLPILIFYLEKHKEGRKTVLFHHVKPVSAYLMLNMYWLLPLILSGMSESNILNRINSEHISAFTSTGTISGNIPISLAMMYGFWREGYVYPFHYYSKWIFIGVYVIILFFAVHGLFSDNRNTRCLKKGLAVSAIISLMLGSGISYQPFAPVFQFLFDHFFIFKGMRDSQKFVSVLVFAYSFLGSIGIDSLIIESKKSRLVSIMPPERYKALKTIILVILILLPTGYSFTFFNGFQGQVEPVDYPDEWYSMNAYLKNDTQDFDVLFFPWHQYMTFSWTNGRIANPASLFFGMNVIRGENMEVGGIYTQSSNPAQYYMQHLLEEKDNITNFGELIVPLNVKYVILAKEVDYRNYNFLYEQEDLEIVMENEKIVLFRNEHNVSRIREAGDFARVSGWEDIIELSSEAEIENYGFIKEPVSQFNTDRDYLQVRSLNYTMHSSFKYQVNENSNYILFTPPNHMTSGWIMEKADKANTTGLVALYGSESRFAGNSIYYYPAMLYSVGTLASLLAALLILRIDRYN